MSDKAKLCHVNDHGAFNGNQCPKCCVHVAQVGLNQGPFCSECLRPLALVRGHELRAVEAELRAYREFIAKVTEGHMAGCASLKPYKNGRTYYPMHACNCLALEAKKLKEGM